MRPLAVALAAFALAVFAGSSVSAKPGYSKAFDACMAKANTTVDMDACNSGELTVRDKALNATYAKAISRAGGAAAAFKAAERAWLAYRDADCGVYEDRKEFGTLGVIEAGHCMIDRTIERTKALDAFAPNPEGPGD